MLSTKPRTQSSSDKAELAGGKTVVGTGRAPTALLRGQGDSSRLGMQAGHCRDVLPDSPFPYRGCTLL